MLFGIFYALATPLLWGLDEVAHFNRTLEVSRGQMVPQVNNKGDIGNDVPSSLSEIEYYVYADLLDDEDLSVSSRKDVSNPDVYRSLGAEELSDAEEPTRITASYSPIAYVGPVVGAYIGERLEMSISQIIHFARIAGLLTYAALVAVSIYMLRNSRMKWVLMVIALFPVSVYQASVVSADTLSNGLGFLLFAAVYSTLVTKVTKANKKEIMTMVCAAILAAILLPLIKSNNIFLSALVVLIPNGLISTKPWRSVSVKILILGFVALLAAMWTRLSTALSTQEVSMRADGAMVDPAGQVQFILQQPMGFIAAFVRSLIDYGDSYVHSTIGLIGWNLAPLPIIFEAVAVVALVFALLFAANELKGLHAFTKLNFSVVALSGIMSSFFVMYLAFSPVAHRTIDGVNGRYFIPYLLPILAVLAAYMPRIELSRVVIRRLVIGVSVLNLIVSCAMYVLVTY